MPHPAPAPGADAAFPPTLDAPLPCPAPGVLQSLVFFRDEDVHLKELLARWTMAFPKVEVGVEGGAGWWVVERGRGQWERSQGAPRMGRLHAVGP